MVLLGFICLLFALTVLSCCHALKRADGWVMHLAQWSDGLRVSELAAAAMPWSRRAQNRPPDRIPLFSSGGHGDDRSSSCNRALPDLLYVPADFRLLRPAR
jgi:hypothetical protein